MIDRIKGYFEFEKHGADLRTEVMGGVTTFMTMAYIIFVNPIILSNHEIGAGMDFNGVMMATCLGSAVATLVMALVARYPIALAPGMGLNAFFSFEIVKGFGVPWQTALGMVFVAGVIFLLLTFFRIREMLINAVPDTLKHSIAAGIGLFIAFIGLQHAGLVRGSPATLVELGDLSSPAVLISLASIAATAVMLVAGVRGAILWGILAAGALGLLFGEIRPADNMALPTLRPFQWQALVLVLIFFGTGLGLHWKKIWGAFGMGAVAAITAGLIAGWIKLGAGSIVARPPSMAAVAFKLDVVGAFSHWQWFFLALALLFFALFDTVGTLIGVSEQAGFIKDGKLPRATQALAADACGTIAGSLFGTSTVTCYIESAAGVAAGARTGLASVVTALLFLAAMFFAPLANILSVGMVTAPALIIVGCMMMAGIAKIPWRDYAEAVPAFLTMMLMPLTFSISRGLVAGFISWPLLMAASGRARQVHAFMYVLAAVLAVAVALSYVIL
ncbi:MAG TPA: NCS2 family permease [bacterium]|nr:NCS2 family permease [bacterium]